MTVFIFLFCLITIIILLKLLYEIGFGIPKRLELLEEKIANLKLHVQETKLIIRDVEDNITKATEDCVISPSASEVSHSLK